MQWSSLAEACVPFFEYRRFPRQNYMPHLPSHTLTTLSAVYAKNGSLLETIKKQPL